MAGAIQIAGALLILVAYLLSLGGRLDADSYAYLLANLAGSTTLAVLAALQPSWGFLLLEGTWAVASAWGLRQRLSGTSAAPPGGRSPRPSRSARGA